MTQKAARAVLRVSFAKVAGTRSGAWSTSTQTPVIAVVSDAVGERELVWGEQLDVREIAAYGTDPELTDQAVAACMAKYATKSADASGTLDHTLLCRPCQGRGATLLPHGTPLPCTACDGTGQARPLPRLAVTRHIRQMIRTCWDLGRLPEFAHLKLRKWAHMLGFRGHFSTKSRCYSTTLGALRDARRAWRTEQTRAHAGLPEPDPTTTLVVDQWDYLGSGYIPARPSSPPTCGTARNWNGSSRPKGAADDLAPARSPPHRDGPGSGVADGSPGYGPSPARPLRHLRPAPLRPARLDHPRPRPTRYLVPGLDKKRLAKVTAKDVRTWLNQLCTTCQCCARGIDTGRDEPRCCAAGSCCSKRLR